MERIIFKSKIHRATVTEANLNYEGSLTIDPELMQAADILPYEKVDVININTGARFTTYAIKGQHPGNGEICLNGGAARLGHTGDLLIIITYAHVDEQELADFKVKVVLVDQNNRIVSVREDTIE
jgi:aspartate 1-decarboxylase